MEEGTRGEGRGTKTNYGLWIMDYGLWIMDYGVCIQQRSCDILVAKICFFKL